MASTPNQTTPATLGYSVQRGVDFQECLSAQVAVRDRLVAGEGPPHLFIVEHPATITLGRRATREDVLWTDDQLAEAGVAVHDTPRGGEATLHAPGQLVAYPIVHVGKGIRAHIVRIAETSRLLAEELGVEGAEFRMEHPGLWVGESKLASIGIHVSRGVCVQGTSLNVQVQPDLFGALVSCGLPQVKMVGLSDLWGPKGEGKTFEELAQRWAELYAQACGWVAEPVVAPTV